MKHLELFENWSKKQDDWENLINNVTELSTSLKTKIMFEKPLPLEIDGKKTRWFIHGVQPDKNHDALKVFYDDGYGQVKKVDFFDFHDEEYTSLLKLIKDNIK